MKMAEIKTIYKGESVTLLFTFPEAYDMTRFASHKVFVGETEFTGVVEGQAIKMQLKSSDTNRMIGMHKVVIWIDDAVLGLRKPYCGELVVAKTQAAGNTVSVSNISDIIIPIVISETAITVGDVLYNYVKGDKGDPFLYSDFTPEQIEALKVKGDAFEYSDFTPEQLESLKVKGDPFTYSDFTPEQIAELQQPAADAIASIEAVEQSVEQAETLRVTAEQDRQTNTATAIQNAENATTGANNAASLANTKAGLANDAATLANTKAGLADTAAINADNARLAIQSDLGAKADKSTVTELIQLLGRKIATVVNGVITRIQTVFSYYKERVEDANGVVVSDSTTDDYLKLCYDNNMLEYINFAWLGDGGSIIENGKVSKIFSLDNVNDATQVVSTSQPYITGNIAPNERLGLKNPNGDSREIVHPDIVISGNTTVTKVEQSELTGKYLITHTELTTGTLNSIAPNGRLAAKVIRSGLLTSAQKLAEYNYLRALYPEIESVVIGTQTWATSNLEMVSTPQGNLIANVTDQTAWNNSTTTYDTVYAATSGTAEEKTYAAVKAAAMWCYYNNDSAIGAVYGKLYNWYAAKLLQMDIDYYNAANPTALWGWHVPTSTDIGTLITTLGGESVAIGKMKVAGTDYWLTPNTGADNSSGFSIIGTGIRSTIFNGMLMNCTLWTIDKIILPLMSDRSGIYYFGIEDAYRGCTLRLIKS